MTLTDIQRYEPWPQEWPVEDPNGNLVTYEDHRKIVEQLLEELSACTGGTGGCGYWREATKKRDEQIENLRLLIDELTKTCERLLEERKSLINAVNTLS